MEEGSGYTWGEEEWPGEDVDLDEMNFCQYLESNFLFYSSWWVIIILQVVSLFVLGAVSVCILDPCAGKKDRTSLLNATNIGALYVQATFWFWLIYLISAGTSCGIAVGEPLMITGIIFVILAYLSNIFYHCSTNEDKAILSRNSIKELQRYFEAARAMAPRDQITGSAYHYEQEINHQGKPRSVKRRTYGGSETFIYDKWLDQSEFPDIGPVTPDCPLTIVAFTFETEPGDSYTTAEWDTFKSNYESFVKQLDSSTSKFVHLIQVLSGNDSEEFHTKFVARQNKDAKNEDSQDKEEKEEKEESEDIETILDSDKYKQIISVGEEGVALPWYMNSCLLLVLNTLCLSFLLKVIIDFKTKKYHFVIKKLFFSDPRNPHKSYGFISNPVMPYMGPGREMMPLVSATRPSGVYVRPDQPVVQRPFGSANNSMEKNQLVSYFEDIKKLSDVQSY